MPPQGVIVTRPEPDASETATLVAARGFAPIVAPLLRLRLRSIAAAGSYDAVIATSRNAIPALPERLRPVPLLAVGGATAQRARASGFATVLDADGDAADLATLAQARLPPGAHLLFVHGSGQGDALAATLQAAGFRVTRRRAYAVRAVPSLPRSAAAALRSGDVRAVMFLSAETARAFVGLLPTTLRPLLGGVDALAIGPVAADVLAPLPWHRVRVSVRPTLDEVLALL